MLHNFMNLVQDEVQQPPPISETIFQTSTFSGQLSGRRYKYQTRHFRKSRRGNASHFFSHIFPLFLAQWSHNFQTLSKMFFFSCSYNLVLGTRLTILITTSTWQHPPPQTYFTKKPTQTVSSSQSDIIIPTTPPGNTVLVLRW